VIGVVGISHQTDEQLELYALGRLSPPLVAEVEEHLLVCGSCQERVDDLQAYAFAMREAIASEPAQPARWHWQSWLQMPALVWAGGIASIVFAIGIYLQVSPQVAPLAALQLTAMRGAMPSVAASRETDITLADAPSETALRAEVINSSGSALWSGALESRTHTIPVTRRLAPGNYFVRLYGDGGKLLHEYGFQVKAGL